MASSPPRHWSFERARAVLPEVRARTARAARQTETLLEHRDRARPRSGERTKIERHLQRIVDLWTREMEALGVEVKGLWLVDFDNGRGYYCWRWPEEDLAYFHGYEEGFAGRLRIQ